MLSLSLSLLQDCSVTAWRVFSAHNVRLLWRRVSAHQLAVNVVVLSWRWSLPAAARDQGFESLATTSSSSPSSSSGNSQSQSQSQSNANSHRIVNENDMEVVAGQYQLARAWDFAPALGTLPMTTVIPFLQPSAFPQLNVPVPAFASQISPVTQSDLNVWQPHTFNVPPAGPQYFAPFAVGARLNDLDSGMPAASAFSALSSTSATVSRTTPLNIGCGFHNNIDNNGLLADETTESNNSNAMLTSNANSNSLGSGTEEPQIPRKSLMQYVVTGGGDRHICVWDARSGVLKATLRGHRRGVTSLATLAPDACAVRPHLELQSLLVSGGADCEIR